MINKKQNKAQGLPINIVVTLIIGIIIFSLGMGLFSKISSSGEDEVDYLMNKVKTGIASLECEGDDWICSPSYTMKNGNTNTFSLFIANRGDKSTTYTIEIKTQSITDDNKQGILKDGCGSVFISYPPIEFKITSGQSAEIPFMVKATKVTNTPCNFVTVATLKEVGNLQFQEKTSIIIKVE